MRPLRIAISPVVPVALVASLLVLSACQPGLEDGYRVEIRRTSHGIAHIEAADLASLGYGEGYAQAEDHLCSIADQVVMARGERAKYFGAGPDNAHLLNDIGLRSLRIHEQAPDQMAALGTEIRDWYQGFVDGYNQYLVETGADNVPGWCAGQAWVLPITVQDLAAYHGVVTLVSSRFAAMIAGAVPPEAGASAPPTASGGAPLAPELGASNGWAFGSDWSEAGRGMLIANPHYPWVGSNRFWEKHLTVPGDLDVYGVGLLGLPGVAIGFNDAVGWTHTVSAGARFTLYSLDLVSGQPTTYLYDGEERAMTSRSVSVDVRQDDDSVETVEQDVWFSHYGPVVAFPGIGWTGDRALALRDANQDNQEGRRQWLDMDRATSLAELQQAHADNQGMPWVNTIATSAEGIAWYADSSSTPLLSEEALAAWAQLRENDPFYAAMWQRGTVTLPGSDSKFEWQSDPDARDPGVVAFEDMPQMERRDYVFNANDSFWMANAEALLEGDYSPLHGVQGSQRSLRTRNNALTLSQQSPDQPAGDNGKFSLDEMSAALLSNRSYAAELLKPELVEHCQATPRASVDGERVDLQEACTVLAAWDDRFDLDSRGAVLFREWIGQYEPADLGGKGRLFAVDFDPADPVHSPRGLADGKLALQHLAQAVRVLQSQQLALDVALGDLQYPPSKTARRIPIHGGNGGWEGVMNMQQASTNTTTMEPLQLAPAVAGSRFLTEAGYPVVHGSSFLMALEYTDDGPRAQAFLTYSQSGDPTSEHFNDQTELYSKKQWRPIVFDEEAIAADTKRSYTLTGSRNGGE